MRMEHPLISTRAIAIAAAAVGLLAVSCGGPAHPPKSVSRFPADLANRELQPAGIFEDGWVSPTASLDLDQPGGKQLLAVRGMVPKVGRDDYRTSLDVRVDREVVATQTLGLGDFALVARVPEKPGKHRIDLVFSTPQVLPAADGRVIGAHLSFVGFERAGAGRPAGLDILGAGAGMQLGSGWDVLESFQTDTFRWVNNDAQLLIAAQQPGTRRLKLTLASGPGLEGRDFLLQARDASGRQVDAVAVRGRQTVELFLPVEAGQQNDFRLHVDGGGKPTPGKDTRVLNFRVFEIDAD